MPILSNPKHETFAAGLADGLKAIDAYERAGYPRSASAASQLKNQAAIEQRVQELIQAKNDIAAATADDMDNLPSELSRDWLVRTLMKNVALAQDARQITPANKAVEMLAQLIGYSFKTPQSNKDDDDSGATKKPEDFNMDAFAAGLDKIGSLVANKEKEEEESE